MLYKDAKKTGNASGEEALRQLFFYGPSPFCTFLKRSVYLKKRAKRLGVRKDKMCVLDI